MKTIIIGDIHNYVNGIEDLIGSIEHDNVIFLGDYFDNFGDSPYTAGKTATWLANSLTYENRIHLMGNHDMPYRYYGNNYLDCPGFSKAKSKVINSTMNNLGADWDKIKFAHFDHKHNFIFSHAGLTEKLFPSCPVNGPDLIKMESRILQAEDQLRKCPLERVDVVGGNIDPSYNGITWIRPNSFKIIPDVTQVVGHTPTCLLENVPFIEGRPVLRKEGTGRVWYMDCFHSWFGIYEDGVLTPFNKKTLEPMIYQDLD